MFYFLFQFAPPPHEESPVQINEICECSSCAGFIIFSIFYIYLQAPFPTYNPPIYTSPSVAKKPSWADVDVMSL